MICRCTIAAAVGSAALGLSHPAGAQEISKGLNLVGLTFSYDHRSSNTQGSRISYTLSLAGERLLTDRIGAVAALTYHRDGRTFGEASAGPSYYLKRGGGSAPYLVARGGIGFGDSPKSFYLGAGLGYLALLGAERRGGALKVELAYAYRRYARYAYSHYVFPAEHVGHLTLVVGVSFYFRAKPSAPTS